MREKRASQEPDDETRPNKTASTGSFLASWLTGLERKEPNLKDTEADLDNPEEVGKKPDGFSRRWHKLFRGVFGRPELVSKADDPRLEKLKDNARNAAYSSRDMAEIVAEGQTADHLSNREIVAAKPAKPEWEALASEPVEAIPRVSPAEVKHEHEYEDNLEAPGAPTKGYRGLLKVDHSDEVKSAKKTASVEESPLPHAESAAESSKKDDYILPKQPSKPLENYHYPKVSANSELSLPVIDRRVQSMIDRPALILPPEVTSRMAAVHLKQPSSGEPVAPPESPEMTSRPVAEAVEAGQQPTERAYELSHESKDLPTSPPPADDPYQDSESEMEPTEQSAPTTGATPVGSILSTSPLYKAPAARVPQTATKKPQIEPAPATPELKSTPQPIYTPPTPTQRQVPPEIYAPQSSLEIPVLEEGRYRQAIINGFWGGIIISAITAIVYLFG